MLAFSSKNRGDIQIEMLAFSDRNASFFNRVFQVVMRIFRGGKTEKTFVQKQHVKNFSIKGRKLAVKRDR